MKIKITGRNDDLKEIARLLVDQYVGFKFDGENKIVADHHLSERGHNLIEKFTEFYPTIVATEVKPRTKK